MAGALHREAFWLVSDDLGTPRMVFDKTGALANVKRHDYLPFGEELSTGQGVRTTTLGYGAVDNIRQKFTSQERDNETGLDYMHARYFASAQGRFTSADSVSGSIGSPQSLNRYAYVGNNPMNFTDPTGHMPSIHQYSATRNGEGDGGYSSADASQDSAAYDQRLQNTRDAIAANEAQARGDLDTRDAIMERNSTLEFAGSVTVSAQVGAPQQQQEPQQQHQQQNQDQALTPAQQQMKDRLVSAQDDARNNQDYAPDPDGTTYCNIATAEIATRVGAPVGPLQENTASRIWPIDKPKT